MSKGGKKDKAQAKIGSSSGFVSFSSVSSSSSHTSSSRAVSTSEETSSGLTPVYTGSNCELIIISKKLLKKDGVTKVKALTDLDDVLKAASPEAARDEMMPQLIPFFVYIYLRLISDDDRKVREKLGVVLHQLISIDKRALGPHMGALLGPWWVSMSDASPEVASIAKSCFELAIPKVKRPQVVAYLGPNVLRHIQINLSYTVETIVDMKDSNSKDNKADLEERFERVVTSTLGALSSLLLFLDEKEHRPLIDGTAGTGYRDIFVENFWKKALSKRDAVRRSAYTLLTTAIKRAPAVFDGHSVTRISSFLVTFLSEGSAGNVGAMFDLVLVLLNHYKSCAVFHDAKLNAEFMAKIKALVHSFPSVAIQYLVPLFGCFPPSAVSIRHSAGSAASSYDEIISVVDYLLEISETRTFPEQLLQAVDCCVCEISLLILLRQPDAADACLGSEAALHSAKAVTDRFMRSFVLLARASTGADRTLTRLLLAFQRAQAKQINFSATQWAEIFWDVLGSTLHRCLSNDTESIVRGAVGADGKASSLDIARCQQLVSTLSDSVFECYHAYLETETSIDGLGLSKLLRGLADSLSEELRSAAGAEDPETILSCVIKARSLAILTERNVDILGAVDAHKCLGATVSEWVMGCTGLLSRQGPPIEAHIALQLSGQFYQFLVSLRRCLLARPLASETSSYTYRLLGYFIRSDFIGGIIALFDSRLLSRKSDLGSDLCTSVAYLKKTFADCVSNAIDSDRAQQALQYSARAVMCLPDAISSELLTLLDDSMGGGSVSRSCTFVYLSMLASRSENAMSRFDSLSGTDMLMRLFFNRLRDVRERPQLLSSSQESCVRVASDWDSTRRLVLPLLSVEQQSRLCELIAAELSSSIRGCSEGPHAMQANKLARHVSSLLALPHQACRADSPVPYFGRYDSSAILSLVELGNPSFWESMQDQIITSTRLEFTLDVVLTVDRLWMENSVAKTGQNSFLGAGLCVGAELLIGICTFIERCRARLPPCESSDIIMEKLTLLSITAYNHVKESSDSERLSLLRSMTSLGLPDPGSAAAIASAVGEIFRHNLYSYRVDASLPVDKRLVLDTPLPLDTLLRGAAVMYVRRGGGGGAELVQARVTQSHIEPPHEPYHTLEVGGSEVQTGCDRIILSASPLAAPKGITETVPPSDEPDAVSSHLSSWLVCLLPRFTEALAGRSDTGIEPTMAVLDVAFEIVSVSAGKRVEGILEQYRDLAVQMLGVDPLVQRAIFSLGINLFLSLLRGIRYPAHPAEMAWLIAALRSVNSAVASLKNGLLHSRSPDEFLCKAISSICLFYGSITMKVKWRACIKHTLAFLSWSLGYLMSSSGTDGAPLEHLIGCAHSCFYDRWKSLHSSAQPQKSNSVQAIDGPATAALERSFAGKDSERDDEVENLSFRLCLRVMIGERHSQELKLRCADTILCFLVARDALLLSHFMRQIITDDLEQSLVDSTIATNIHSQIRLCASRILSALYFSARGPVLHAALPDGGSGDGESDDAEYHANASLFREIVGVEIATELGMRFKSATKKNSTGAMGDVLKAKQKDWTGSILLWLLCLQKIDANSANGHESRARCGQHLSQSKILESALFLMLQIVPDLLKFKKLSNVFDEIRFLADREQLQNLASYAMFRTVCTFPAMTRSWWSDSCDRNQKQRVSKFIEERVRTALITREVCHVEAGLINKRWDNSEFQVKGSIVSGEITGSLQLEDTRVEVKITLPPSYPLKNVEVVSSKIGIADDRVRRWVLQIIQMLSLQDGAVIDALLMWKKNVEKELEGIEACPICYSILHPKSMSLPNLCCSTCNNKFHSACLYTWFKSSGKTKCVICQQVWQ